MSGYDVINPDKLVFKPQTIDSATFTVMGETYVIPAVEHPQSDALTSLCAVVIELHKRVQTLEEKLESIVNV